VNNDELKHVGVIGMRWGTRRGQLYRKQTMLTKGRQEVLDKKELSRLEGKPHQKKLDAQKIAVLRERLSNTKSKGQSPLRSLNNAQKLVGVVLVGVGGYTIGSLVQRRTSDKKFAAAEKHGRQKIQQLLNEARAGNLVLDAKYKAMKVIYPYI